DPDRVRLGVVRGVLRGRGRPVPGQVRDAGPGPGPERLARLANREPGEPVPTTRGPAVVREQDLTRVVQGDNDGDPFGVVQVGPQGVELVRPEPVRRGRFGQRHRGNSGAELLYVVVPVTLRPGHPTGRGRPGPERGPGLLTRLGFLFRLREEPD